MVSNPQDFVSKYDELKEIRTTPYAKIFLVKLRENDKLYVKKSIKCDKNLRDEGLKEV